MSGGRHEDLSRTHVTSVRQSYFVICHERTVILTHYICEELRDARIKPSPIISHVRIIVKDNNNNNKI